MGQVKRNLILVLLTGFYFFGLHSEGYGQFKTVKTDDLNLIYYNFGHEYLLHHTVRSYTNSLRLTTTLLSP